MCSLVETCQRRTTTEVPKGPDPIDEEWFPGQIYDALRVRFSATVGQKPEVEMALY
jgi:hypothetical protein